MLSSCSRTPMLTSTCRTCSTEIPMDPTIPFPGVFESIGQQAVLAIQGCENGSHVLESELAPRCRQTNSQRGRRMARFPLGMASLDLRPEEQSRICRRAGSIAGSLGNQRTFSIRGTCPLTHFTVSVFEGGLYAEHDRGISSVRLCFPPTGCTAVAP